MRYWKSCISILTFLMSIAFVAVGQSTKEAKALVESVSKRYGNFKTLTSDFVLQKEGTTLQKGTLILDHSTGKYRMNLNGQTLLSDGTTQWSIMEDIKEVQLTDITGMEDQISPKNLFSFFKKGYVTTLGKEQKMGNKTYTVIALTPEDKNKSHSKIELLVMKGSLQIDQINLFEKSGEVYVYLLKNQVPNKAFDKDTFVFRKENYKGYELVDLR